MNPVINGRSFTHAQLRAIFHHLDADATRASIRRLVSTQQGRGISNETVAALRKAHRQLRRSQGYAIGPRAKANLRETPSAPLVRLMDFDSRLILPATRRPEPPRIEGLKERVVVRYEILDNGRRTGVTELHEFTVDSDRSDLGDQVAKARDKGFGSLAMPGTIGGRGYEVIAVRTDIDDL